MSYFLWIKVSPDRLEFLVHWGICLLTNLELEGGETAANAEDADKFGHTVERLRPIFENYTGEVTAHLHSTCLFKANVALVSSTGITAKCLSYPLFDVGGLNDAFDRLFLNPFSRFQDLLGEEGPDQLRRGVCQLLGPSGRSIFPAETLVFPCSAHA